MTATPADLGKTNFEQSFDARDWAEAFVKRVKHFGPEFATDFDNMVGWFANAIMRGCDEGKKGRVA